MLIKSLLVNFLIYASVINIFFIFYILWKKIGNRVAYILAIITVIIYSLGYAMELSSSSLHAMYRFRKIEYLGMAFLPTFLFIMIAELSGRFTGRRKGIYILLFLISLMYLIVVLTNGRHHLYYRSVFLNTECPFPLMGIEKGPLYIGFIMYVYICILSGNILLILLYMESAEPFRMQTMAVLLSSLIPWIGSIIYQMGKVPYNIDVSPVAGSLTCMFLGLSILRLKTFRISPVARKLVFEELSDPVIVLTKHEFLADYNTAAALLFPSLTMQTIGLHLRKIPGISVDLIRFIETGNEEREMIQIEDMEESCYYQVRKTRMNNTEARLEGFILTLTDLTLQVNLQQRLEDLAARDGLTQVFNRRHFTELAEQEVKRSIRSGRPVCLIIFDLDRFKIINDTLGHKAGDLALVETVKCIETNLRNFDIFGRYGGEEFIIFLPETEVKAGVVIAERLRTSLAAHRIVFEGHKLTCTASFGIAGSCGEGTSLSQLTISADKALYRAKAKGRNRIETAR